MWHDKDVDWPIDGDWRDQDLFTLTVGPAPSGRATCKYSTCKETIEKGLLRVQTDFNHGDDHGGSSCGAFHLQCFIESQKKWSNKDGIWKHMGYSWGKVTKPEIQFHGWDRMSKSDQEEVKKLYKESASGKGAAVAPAASASWELGYAFAARTLAKCRVAGCGKEIAVGDLRIGTPFAAPNGEIWKSWHHVDCFFDHQEDELKKNSGALPTGATPLTLSHQLSGFEKVKGADQQKIKDKLAASAALAVGGAAAAPDAMADDEDEDDAPASKPAAKGKGKAKAPAKAKAAAPAKKKAAAGKRKKKVDSDEEEEEDDDYEEEESDYEEEEQPKKKKRATASKKK